MSDFIQYNPPHPGEFIRYSYLEPFDLSVRSLAAYLEVAPSTINRLVNAQSAVTPDMACRLAATLGRSPQSWLAMQANYDLFHTKQHALTKIDFDRYNDAA